MKARADTATSFGLAKTSPAQLVLPPASGAAGLVLAGKYALVREIERGLASVPSRDGTLLRRHYLEGERLDHIARELGVSPSKMSRMHASALESLAKLVGRKTAGPARM